MAFVLIPVESSKKNCSLGKEITQLSAILLLHYCTATASDLPLNYTVSLWCARKIAKGSNYYWQTTRISSLENLAITVFLQY